MIATVAENINCLTVQKTCDYRDQSDKCDDGRGHVAAVQLDQNKLGTPELHDQRIKGFHKGSRGPLIFGLG